MYGITDLSITFLTGFPVITTLVFLIFIGFSFYLYRRTNPPLPRSIRILLALLRLTAVAALFLALFEPVLSYDRIFERKPRLTILKDVSGSMEISEEGKTRLQRIDSLISSPSFSPIADAFDIRTILFSDKPSEDIDSLNRDETALGAVLEEQARREAAEGSESWLILSDGISNHGLAPAEAAARIKTRINAVGIGLESSEQDIAVTGVDYNDIVFAGRPTEITVHLEWTALKNETARLELKNGARTLQRKEINLGAGTLKDEIKINFVPEQPGQQTFQVTVSPLNDEMSDKNNSRSFSMSVMKSRLKVLMVSDRLDWEYSFLNRFLARLESVDLTSVVSRLGGGYLATPFPVRQAELNQYDLVILYDIDVKVYQARVELFESFLKEKGGGLLVILGDNYLRAPYPRWLDAYLPFLVKSRGPRMIYHKFNGIPDENYLFHPVVRLGDSRTAIRDAWRELPPFETIVPVDSIVTGAEILVGSDLGEGERTLPVLGFRRLGPGKVLAGAVAPFWHWKFLVQGVKREAKEYGLFWNGVVNWLALKEESEPVRIVPDKNIYTRGETVGFDAFVYDLGFRSITGASGYIMLKSEATADSNLVQFLETGEGRYRAELELIPSGRYKYFGVIEKDGQKLKEATGEIAIESYTIEEFRRKPDFAAMASAAQLTGGDFVLLKDADSLWADLNTDKIPMSEHNEIAVWNKIWLLTIFIAALGLEWFLRKRWQLL